MLRGDLYDGLDCVIEPIKRLGTPELEARESCQAQDAGWLQLGRPLHHPVIHEALQTIEGRQGHDLHLITPAQKDPAAQLDFRLYIVKDVAKAGPAPMDSHRFAEPQVGRSALS